MTSEAEALAAVLAKVSAQGMQCLTWGEKRSLKRATPTTRR